MCKLNASCFLNITLLFDHHPEEVEDAVFMFNDVKIVEPNSLAIFNLKVKTHNVVNNQVVCTLEQAKGKNNLTKYHVKHEKLDVNFTLLSSLKPRKAVLLIDIDGKIYAFEATPEFGEEYVS